MHNHSNGNELRILMQIILISLTIVEHQDSLRNRDKQQLGNGPLKDTTYNVIERYQIRLRKALNTKVSSIGQKKQTGLAQAAKAKTVECLTR